MAHEGIILENLDMGVIGNGRNLFGTKDYGTPELQYPTPQLGKFKTIGRSYELPKRISYNEE